MWPLNKFNAQSKWILSNDPTRRFSYSTVVGVNEEVAGLLSHLSQERFVVTIFLELCLLGLYVKIVTQILRNKLLCNLLERWDMGQETKSNVTL